jgi:hypothetical protein
MVQTVGAQLVSRQYKDKSMSKVLVDLRRASSNYKITFIHNELEDYTVTKSFERLCIPDAIKECIGFYPINMKVVGDSLIFVEAIQKTGDKLIGRIVDTQKRPICYANITLLDMPDTTKITSGVSNANGDFVIPTTEQQLIIRISCIGYSTQTLHCAPGNIGVITMYETTEHIGEVVIEGSLHRTRQDRDVYLPNQRQRNAANSGIALLDNLMIPQLDVNRITGDIKSLTNKSITYCIDERIVDKAEIEQIRPKDVLRVEYIDMPSGKLADKDLVINFVMRHYDYGGYVEIKDNTSLLYNATDNRVQVSIDHQKMNYTVLLGNKYEKNRSHAMMMEDLYTDKHILKNSTKETDPMKGRTDYAVLRARYQSGSLQLTGSAGITREKTPEYHYTESILYSGDVGENTSANSIVSSQNTTTFLRMGADWNITDKQKLTAVSKISFGRNSYDNTYHESDGYQIDSHTKESTFGWLGDVCYTNTINQRNNITLRVLEIYYHYNDHYSGTLPADQTTSESETIVWPVYIYKPNNKWVFNFRPLGFSVAYWKTKTSSETYFSSRGATLVKYHINKQNNVGCGIYIGNSNPNAAVRSEVEQIVNRYEVLRGNPDLKKTIYSTYFIDYSLMLKHWQLLVHSEYERLDNMTKDTYMAEGEHLVHSYTNDGTLQNLTLNIQQTLFLFNKNLQLKGGLRLKRSLLTGTDGGSLNHIDWNLQAQYHVGDFAFNAYYNAPKSELWSNYRIEHADYGLGATYGHRGFYAEIGARRMFEKDKSIHQYYHWSNYAFDEHRYCNNYGPWIYMRISLSFDFGRKSSRQTIEAGSIDGSAILHK